MHNSEKVERIMEKATTRGLYFVVFGFVMTATLIARARFGLSGIHREKSVAPGGSGSEDNEDDIQSMKEEYDRILGWTESYSSYYESHCGCTGSMVSHIAAAQMDVISRLNLFLYYIPTFEARRELIIEGIARTAQDAVGCLTDDMNCGCFSGTKCENNSTNSSSTGGEEEKSLPSYYDCCCDADVIKHIYISQMEAIGDLPDYIIILGETYIVPMISAIQTADDEIVESIKNRYVCDATEVPTESPSPSQQPSDMPSTAPSASQSPSQYPSRDPTMPDDTPDPDPDPPLDTCDDETTQVGETCTNPGGGPSNNSQSVFVCCNQQGNDKFDCWNCNSCEEHFVYHPTCCDGCNSTHRNCCKCDTGNSGNFQCVDTPLGDPCSC